MRVGLPLEDFIFSAQAVAIAHTSSPSVRAFIPESAAPAPIIRQRLHRSKEDRKVGSAPGADESQDAAEAGDEAVDDTEDLVLPRH